MSTATASVSVCIIAATWSPQLDHLINRGLTSQSLAPAEIVVVVEGDVSKPTTRNTPTAYPSVWVEVPRGRGFAYNRNRALDWASQPIVAFVDDDCWPQPDWLKLLVGALERTDAAASMGCVEVAPSNRLGRAFAALGYPAGGTLGFEMMYGVDGNGRTTGLCTLNCAIRRQVLDALGGFDEALTAGGEDTDLSHRLRRQRAEIVYEPRAIVSHPPRSTMGSITRWFFRKGMAEWQFVRMVDDVRPYLRRRKARQWMVLRASLSREDASLVVAMMFYGLAISAVGRRWEKRRRRTGVSTQPEVAATEVFPPGE